MIKEELGTLDTDMETASERKRTTARSPKLNSIELICAIKMDAIEMKRAAPSVLMLHPMGKMNLVILESILSFVFITRNVIGRAAAL